MGCGCKQRQRNGRGALAAMSAAPTVSLPAGGWTWQVILPDGSIESGYDEIGAVRRAKDSGGRFEAVLPSS